jgi:nicotinamidase-related amidase
VNDNFGRWRSNFNALVDHCLKDGVPGRAVAEQLLPGDDDYFVLKPMHSGFFQTSLDLLLRHLQARTLILAGIAGNNCVLFTAGDAYMRGYRVIVPRDCVVSNGPAQNERALDEMRTVLKANLRASARLDLAGLKKQHK